MTTDVQPRLTIAMNAPDVAIVKERREAIDHMAQRVHQYELELTYQNQVEQWLTEALNAAAGSGMTWVDADYIDALSWQRQEVRRIQGVVAMHKHLVDFLSEALTLWLANRYNFDPFLERWLFIPEKGVLERAL